MCLCAYFFPTQHIFDLNAGSSRCVCVCLCVRIAMEMVYRLFSFPLPPQPPYTVVSCDGFQKSSTGCMLACACVRVLVCDETSFA